MATTTSSKPTLVYFNAAGRGEAIRLAFRIGGVDFDDVRMNVFSFLWTHRSRSPTGRVPYLVVDGKIYTESWACLQYAAEKGGLAPVDPLQQLNVESLALYGDGVMSAIATVVMPSFHKGKLVKAAVEKITNVLEKWNKMIKESLSDGYAVAGKISIADIVIYQTYETLHRKPYGVVIENLDSYDAIKEIHDTVSRLPQLQQPAKK